MVRDWLIYIKRWVLETNGLVLKIMKKKENDV